MSFLSGWAQIRQGSSIALSFRGILTRSGSNKQAQIRLLEVGKTAKLDFMAAHTLWQKEQKSRRKRKNWRKLFFGLFLFGLLTTFYFLNYFRAVVVNPYHPLP